MIHGTASSLQAVGRRETAGRRVFDGESMDKT